MRLRQIVAAAIAAVCIAAVPAVHTYAAQSNSSNSDTSQSTQQSAKLMSVEQEVGDILSPNRMPDDIATYSDSTYDHAHDADIMKALDNVDASINTEGWGITLSNYREIMLGIINVYPQYYYVQSYGCQYYYGQSEAFKLTFNYSADKDTILSQKKEIQSAGAELESAVDMNGLTNLEIALAYHDYLAATTEYAHDHYLNNTLTSEDYSLYGALINHSTVCQGYAQAFLYIMNRLNIDAGIAVSTNANHAWNVIKINGNWYHIDVTFDDPVRDQLGRATHNYFMLSTDDLLAKESSRSDYLIYTKNGVEFSPTTDDSYADGFWSNTDAAMFVDDGLWFYFDHSARAIKACDYPQTDSSVIANVDTYDCKLFLTNGKLLYSTKSDIKSYDTGTRKITTYYTPSINGDNIYTFGMYKGKLAYTYGYDDTLAYVPENADTGLMNKDGTWRYYTNGQFDTSYTGMAYANNRWWYVKNGLIDFKYTGMAYGNGRWWYFNNGAIDFKYTGMAYGNGRWWYFNNGAINFKYTGMAYGNGRWWYFSNGAIDFKYTGTAYYKRWWYFSNGSINFTYTGMGYANNNWWMFQNGAINFKYTGIGQNKSGKWYFRNGQIAWKYSGNVTYGGKTYKVQNGKVVG